MKLSTRLKQLFFPIPTEHKTAFGEHTIADIIRASCLVHLFSAVLQAINIFIVLNMARNNREIIPNPADMGFHYLQLIAFTISVTSLVLFVLLRKRKAWKTLDIFLYCSTIILIITQGYLSSYEFHVANQFFRIILYFVIFSTMVNYSPLKGFFILLSGCIAFALGGSLFSIYNPQFFIVPGVQMDVEIMKSYASSNLAFTVTLCICIFVINYRKSYKDFSYNMERNELTRQLDDANKKLLDISIKDALTSLNNRRALDEYASRIWREHRVNGDMLSIMMFDADYFKSYNDTFGHQAGDEALRSIADVLKHNFSFIRGMLARYGGEEFIAVVPGMDKGIVVTVAERIRAEIEAMGIANPVAVNPKNVLTVSIGVFIGNAKETDSMETCIRFADEALYHAKSQGKNRVVVDALAAH